jgi:hypothetical protein
MQEDDNNWKWWLAAVAIVGVVFSWSDNSSSTPAQTQQEFSAYRSVNSYTPTTLRPAVTDDQINEVYKKSVESTSSGLSNDNYYINVDGNTIHSPAKSLDGGVPAGATARCRDGTYSFSQHRSGTCSHHGGVASWL